MVVEVVVVVEEVVVVVNLVDLWQGDQHPKGRKAGSKLR